MTRTPRPALAWGAWEADEDDVAAILAGARPPRMVPGHGNRLNPDLVEAVRRLAARGASDREVSNRLQGVLSRDAVLKVRNRYRISPGREPSRKR